MAASLSITPSAQGDTQIYQLKTACKVTVTGADQNNVAGYDTALYPTMPEIRYYLHFDGPGTTDLRSYVFAVDENGGHVFNNFIFPDDGTWTVRLRKTDDTDVASLSFAVLA